MSVSIKLLNKEIPVNKQEYNAAIQLKSMLEESMPNSANGVIYIAFSITLTGQSPRDVDILIFGQLDNCILKGHYTNDPSYKKKDLSIDSFCTVIELKDHDSSHVCYNYTHVFVEYQGEWKDATDQNEGQRYSFIRYFKKSCGYEPFVSNFIWLRSLSNQQLDSMKKGNPIGAMPDKFTFASMVDVIISQGHSPYYDSSSKMYRLNATKQCDNFLSDINKCIVFDKIPAAGLTRRKLEILIQNKIQKNIGDAHIGERLMIFKGRAGTGKTFRLIQSALSLANPDNGIRCLILTYNHALVSDIRRLLYFMDIPDGIDSYTIQIKTLHTFFMQLMKSLNIDTSRIFGRNFNKEYEKALNELYQYITQLMESQDIKQLKQDNTLAIDWDYILIDEAQDWSDAEKEILFKVYGPERILVADGVDQFIRSSKKQIWNRNVDDVVVDERKKGMRQKARISEFVNALANELGLNWKVTPNNEPGWAGGRVIVCGKYDNKLHQKLQETIKKAECENYDMLFLVPPTMVDTDDDFSKHFSKLDDWNKAGIKIFDGTNDRNREQYPTDMEMCRMFQYESCRGLEGWVTVCLHFDELIGLKIKEAKKLEFDEDLTLADPKKKQQEYAYLWSLMPLTRPIDTLVIQLTDLSSVIGKHLKAVADAMPDVVTWIE